MDKEWLRDEMASGRSIESIAHELNRDPSTVSYWVHKHGLASSHAERHAARGGIDRELLIAEAGGSCAVCGYDEHSSALQFHHVDPSTKAFAIRDGDTRSLERMREEARKCVLVCANCHAQVEAGAADLPLTSTARALRLESRSEPGPG